MNPLTKIFSCLEAVVSRQESGATYSDIISELDLPKSTIHRVLKDLTDIGYLRFDTETKRYFGSLRLARLGSEVMVNFQLRKHIRPFLEELHQESELTSNLAILDGENGVFVDKIEAKDFGIKLFSEVGKTFPLHCTGLGKIFLAYSPDDLLEGVLKKPLQALTEKTITDAGLLREELAHIRSRKYAIDNEEITRGIICVAAPVFKFNKELVAGISVAFPAYLAQEQGGLDRIIAIVTKHSTRISQSLGGETQ